MSRSGNTSPTASSSKPRRDSEATGATINVTDYDSRNDASMQLQNAQDAITAGVDLIIISPTDSSSAPTVLELAAENNVPVVIADIGTDEGEYVSFVISTNEQGAYDAGKVLMEKMKEMGCEGGDVLMITISQARLNGQNRTKGITRAVEEAGSQIVQFLQSEDYTRAEAQTQASDMLSANPAGVWLLHPARRGGARRICRARGVRTCGQSRLRVFRRQPGKRRVDQAGQARRGLDAAAGADGSHLDGSWV